MIDWFNRWNQNRYVANGQHNLKYCYLYSNILGIKESVLITAYIYFIVEVNGARASLGPWWTSFEFTTSRILFLAIKIRNTGMKFECNCKLKNNLHSRKFEYWMLKYERIPTASARMQITSITCPFQLLLFPKKLMSCSYRGSYCHLSLNFNSILIICN